MSERQHPRDMNVGEVEQYVREFKTQLERRQTHKRRPLPRMRRILAELRREAELSQQRDEAAPRKGQRGRPRIGAGVERISVSMERGLLAEVDAFADEQGLSRAQLISRSVQAELRRRKAG